MFVTSLSQNQRPFEEWRGVQQTSSAVCPCNQLYADVQLVILPWGVVFLMMVIFLHIDVGFVCNTRTVYRGRRERIHTTNVSMSIYDIQQTFFLRRWHSEQRRVPFAPYGLFPFLGILDISVQWMGCSVPPLHSNPACKYCLHYRISIEYHFKYVLPTHSCRCI